jgi:RND superfamily putative drug exporter
MLRRLATAIVARPRAVLAVTVLFLVLAGVFGAGAADRLKAGGFDDPGSESAAAARVLDERFGDSANLVLEVTARGGDIDGADVAASVQRLTRRLAQEPSVTVICSYWAGQSEALRSRDARSGLVLVRVGGDEETAARHAKRIARDLPAEDSAVQVRAGGPLGLADEIDTRVHDDLVLAEAIALPVTLMLLVLVFGGVVAALVPLVMGVASILTTTLLLLGLSYITDVSVHALTVATAFGLGLAIDFGLLMVSRFREERDRGHDERQAVIEAVATAGRTILFSAATVTVALAGMFVFPLYFLRSIGLAAIAVVVVAAIAAVVVLPALLTLAGPRIDSLSLTRRRSQVSADSPFWRRTAAAVMRRPVRTALPVLALLLVLAVPLFHAAFGPADERALPADSPARQLTTDLRTRYTADRAGAITVVAETGASPVDQIDEISVLPGVKRVDIAGGRHDRGVPNAAYLLVHPSDGGQSPAAQALVESIRALPGVAQRPLLVGGPAAVLIDSEQAIVDRLGLALAIVAVAMFVLLFLFTGSIVVPLKALTLNVFVLAAVLGTMVWVFQDGHLASVLGVTPAPLNIPMTVLLCTVVFGLSVDYEIFLLGRIKEARDRGASTAQATVAGLGRIGRIVTSAAAVLTVTLFSFSTGLPFMKMFGIGTGLAILIDATLIRAVLVPAIMQLAGECNWWAPRPLRRLHAWIGLGDAPRWSAVRRPVTLTAVLPAAEFGRRR